MKQYLELVNESFTEDNLEKATFKNYPYVAYSYKENQILFTECPMYTVRFLEQDEIPQLEYREIDLGLPSGIKWADRNVGAKSPEARGAVFTWGSVEGSIYSDIMKISIYDMMPGETHETLIQKDNDIIEQFGNRNIANIMTMSDLSYNRDEYKWNKSTTNADGEVVYKLTKYCESADSGLNGFVDNKLILDPEDDAATVHMGDGWRTPTKQEAKELIDNTDVILVDQNGDEYWEPSTTGQNTQNLPEYDSTDKSIIIVGVKLISKINGNYIYCPYTSSYFLGILLDGQYASVGYWTSEIIPLSVSQTFGQGMFQDNSPSALAYYFTPTSIPISSSSVERNLNRWCPASIRGVKN